MPSVTVQDVHKVPGHIACDASTQCELVVPLVLHASSTPADHQHNSIVLGVLDLDCQRADSWSSEDEEGLRMIVDWLMREDGVVDWTGAVRRHL
jgi:L-methionine (R)-S-oxide reductase